MLSEKKNFFIVGIRGRTCYPSLLIKKSGNHLYFHIFDVSGIRFLKNVYKT